MRNMAATTSTIATSDPRKGIAEIGHAVQGIWRGVLGTRDEAPRALAAPHHTIDIALIGRVGYYADTSASGRPLVLLHAISAAASAFDVRPLFEAFRGERPVYAPDLPGFGTSDRGPNQYSPTLYARAIERFLVDVVSPRDEPVDVVALSLTGEIAARVAVEHPTLFRTLTLISPTGLDREPRKVDAARATRIERALNVPLWATPMYRALTSRPSVRYFLRKSFADEVPRDYVDHAVRTSRVPGAHHAPFAFVAGSLFTSDACATLYERLRVPTQVLYDRDPYTDFGRLEALTQRNPAVHARRIAGTRGMPHFERCEEVMRAMRDLEDDARRGEGAQVRA
ncbi:MAG: alpha/beta fold hydrolase [Myxococcota bacterium]|nr:alpha/beta fold hydrolase [Myxococcota bacterium]